MVVPLSGPAVRPDSTQKKVYMKIVYVLFSLPIQADLRSVETNLETPREKEVASSLF